MDAERHDVLVLCVGNLLAGDDGVGVHVAQRLERSGPPPRVRVVDGGTLGLDLLPLFDTAAALVIVDAAELGMDAGSVRVLEGDDLHAVFSRHLSAHQVGALGSLLGSLPDRVALVAIQPGPWTGLSTDLSPPVAGAVEAAMRAAVETALVMAGT